MRTRSAGLSTRRLRHLGLALVVASAALVATSPSALAFTPAAHTRVPVLQKNNYVGKPLRLVTFVQADAHPTDPTTFASRVLWFGKALVNSNWYSAASAAYNLGAHGIAFGRRVQMPISDSTTTFTQMTNKVRFWMHQMGLQKNPAVRTVFLLYLRCVPGTTWVNGIGGCGTAAWHPQLAMNSPDADFTPGDSMALSWVPEGGTTTVDGATFVATHELMEAVTDTDGPGYQMHTNTPTFPYDVSPWIYNENQNGNTEVMDMAGGSRITEQFVNATHGYAYKYERVFTNPAANANHDPFVPASPLGYASVTNGTNGWVRQSSGGPRDHHIALTAWSTQAVPDWTLSVSVAAWKGGGNKPTPTPDRCSASLSRTTVNNGDHLTLTIHYSGLRTARYWCAVKVKSTTAGAAPGDTTNDKFRQWLVGLRLEP
jgi:hypothetical protein